MARTTVRPKNLIAAGEGEIRHRSHTIRFSKPELIATDDHIVAMPRVVSIILRMINVTEFLRVKKWR